MDESIIYLKEKFSLPQVDIQTYSPLTLAYIGDAAYELVVRTFLVDQGNSRPEEELSVYRRGRTAKSPTMAKNASMSDYRKATGFEALMGYLYLKGEQKRLIDLVYAGFVSQGFIAE